MNTINFLFTPSTKRKRQAGDLQLNGETLTPEPTPKKVKTSDLYKVRDDEIMSELADDQCTVANYQEGEGEEELEELQEGGGEQDAESREDAQLPPPLPSPAVNTLQALIRKLKTTNISLEVKLLELEAKNTKLCTEKNLLQVAIDESVEKINDKKARSARLQSDNANLMTTLAGSRDKVCALEAEVVARDADIEILKSTNTRLSDDLAIIKGDKAELQARDRIRDAREIDLQERTEALEERTKARDRSLRDRVRELEEMNGKLTWKVEWARTKYEMGGVGEQSGGEGEKAFKNAKKRSHGFHRSGKTVQASEEMNVPATPTQDL